MSLETCSARAHLELLCSAQTRRLESSLQSRCWIRSTLRSRARSSTCTLSETYLPSASTPTLSSFSTFQDKANLYYVLELAPNGELLSFIRQHKTLSLSCVPFYSAELVLAVEYLHSLGIVHRDLKPENLLLDENMHLKLTDFGTAKQIGTELRARSESFVGTAEYISPELLEQKMASRQSDIWAIGCIIYQMICGRPAFRGATEFLTFQKVRQGAVQYPEGFPAVARDLIAKILVLNPDERYTIAQIKSNRFFNLIDWDRIHQ